ncbi:MAG: hypothetical protein IPH61_09350 [Bacteroidetes bacterium]|nr:hypothetical protein [Bacteroidota bacterium]
MSNSLHIISFNVPYPPDYGGVIDVYYKIKALHAAGVKIHLHTFIYGRKESSELESLCESVKYYKRKPMWQGIFTNKPMIVDSRRSNALLQNLLKDNYPILFEGLHACYYLNDVKLSKRFKMVRMHNNEAEYYFSLAKREKSFINSIYYYEEFKRLKLFEKKLKSADYLLAIAHHEKDYYKKIFNNTLYVGPFHGNTTVTAKPGHGKYALYHGNLSISENQEAAMYLIEQVFNEMDLHLIIAGLQPGEVLKKSISKIENISLIDSPADCELQELVANAHVNILPSFQKTGVKLKLINSLFNGRFCLTNHLMVDQTGMEKYCTIANTPHEMKTALYDLMEREFTNEDLEFRKLIETEYSNKTGAELVIQLMQ